MPPSPDLRAQLLAQAERAVRRGEFKEGLSAYRQALELQPDDPGVRARIASIEKLVPASELSGAAPAPAAAPAPLEPASTPEQAAEALAEHGDLPGALAAYERILASRPGHQLARERCNELRAIVGESAAAPVAAERPQPPGEPDLPRDPDALLSALLSRIGNRRRPGTP